jgi:hypothetical protein
MSIISDKIIVTYALCIYNFIYALILNTYKQKVIETMPKTFLTTAFQDKYLSCFEY